ncbi:hypothetical protein MKZ25_18575 [Solibacillus sp. FSL W7-1464]|uniref:hypothetical protein n=1 Tax=Solibacillus sp. FSL W7-1464 TaxID=2921706 RepID=UPI0030F5805D
MDKRLQKMYTNQNKRELGVVDLTVEIPVKPTEKVDNKVTEKIKSIKSNNKNNIHEMVEALGLDGKAFGQNLMDVYRQSR